MLGEIFPDLSRMRWVVPDRAYLEDSEDHELIDAVDYWIADRVKKEPDTDGRFPEIEPESDLEAKILAFQQDISRAVKWGREEGRKKIQYDDDGKYDPDGWTRYIREKAKEAAAKISLTPEERKKIIDAILNFRHYTREDWQKEFGMGERYGDYDNSRENRITMTEQKTSEDDIDWFQIEPLDSRNYSLFAVLANVRNGDDGVTPICEPKGQAAKWERVDDPDDPENWHHVPTGEAKLYPEDASEEVKQFMVNYMGVDGHSHTWLTLAELESYDFEDDVIYKGIVSEAAYKKMKENGWPENPYTGPDTWAGGIGGGRGAAVFTSDAYEKWVAVNRPRINFDERGMLYGANVTDQMIPDEPTGENYEKVDRWREELGWDDEMIAEAEKNGDEGFLPDRYSYNGITPMLYVEFREKRKNVMGEEFKNMMRIFRELVDTHEISRDDVRVCMLFDN